MLQHEDKKYTPEEQQRIVQLAIELQSRESENLTSSDLMQAAAEAGVDPRYVQQAIAVLQEPTPPTRSTELPASSVTTPLLALLACLQPACSYLQFVGTPTDQISHIFPVTVGISLLAGILVCENPRQRGWSYLSGPALLLLCTAFNSIFLEASLRRGPDANWLAFFALLFFGEVAAIATGVGLGRAYRAAVRAWTKRLLARETKLA